MSTGSDQLPLSQPSSTQNDEEPLIPTAIAPIFAPRLFSDKPEFQNGMRAAFYFTGFLLAAFIDLAMAGYLFIR